MPDQRLRQLQDDLREAERARLETESHLGHDRTLLATLGEELAMLEPEQEITAAAAEESAAALEEAETGMHGWQEQWDAFNQRSAEPRRQAEVQQSRIQQLEQSLERLSERQRRLGDELQQLAADPEDAAIIELGEEIHVEKARMGMLVMIQEKSVRPELFEALAALPLCPPLCLVTDDVAPDAIAERGHVDHVARCAVQAGMPPLEVLRAE